MADDTVELHLSKADGSTCTIFAHTGETVSDLLSHARPLLDIEPHKKLTLVQGCEVVVSTMVAAKLAGLPLTLIQSDATYFSGKRFSFACSSGGSSIIFNLFLDPDGTAFADIGNRDGVSPFEWVCGEGRWQVSDSITEDVVVLSNLEEHGLDGELRSQGVNFDEFVLAGDVDIDFRQVESFPETRTMYDSTAPSSAASFQLGDIVETLDLESDVGKQLLGHAGRIILWLEDKQRFRVRFPKVSMDMEALPISDFNLKPEKLRKVKVSESR